MDYKQIGMHIRTKRLERNWTQENLAEQTELSVTYIGMIGRGIKLPRLETFVHITNVLNASADEILGGVIKNGYVVRISKYYERLHQLPKEKQKMLSDIMELFFESDVH